MPFTAVARANILQNIVQFNGGSAASPGVSFVTSPSTGLFLSGANVGVTVGGVEKASVSSSGLTVNGSVSATYYTGNGSQLTGLATPMTISNVQITSNTWTVLDDLAVWTDGGYIIVNGSGFAPGSMVSAGSDFASSTSFVSNTQLKAQLPAKTSGSYTVTVTRGDTVTASLPFGITYSSFPAWSTSTDLGNVTQNITYTRTLAAPSDSTVTYANTSALPPQTTLASNGTLSGNITDVAEDTTYTFGVKATDAELQDVPRTFSLQYFLAFIARKLTASDKAANDSFGNSISLSGDGTRIIIGAYGVGGASGAAYIFARSGTTWVQEAKLSSTDSLGNDRYAVSVAMDSTGTRAVVGDQTSNNVSPAYRGRVHVYVRSGTTWTRETILYANDSAYSDYLGRTVSMSSDGSRVLAGAYYKSVGGLTGAGAAYIFTRTGTSWTQEAKLTASDYAANDYFGRQIGMSGDGSRVIVGVYSKSVGGLTGAGAAYVFVRSGTVWTQESKLIASDKATSDNFGRSVSIAADGSRVIVGALTDPGGLTNAGAAYVFVRSGTVWTQESELTASDKAAGDWFGCSVTMDSSGRRVAIGAQLAYPGGLTNAGAVYMCGYSGGSWVSY